MKVELKEQRPDMAKELYAMFQELPRKDVFDQSNEMNGLTEEMFELALQYDYRREYGFELARGFVPTLRFLLYIDGKPVGVSGLRPKLNKYYEKHGGNIWYKIIPSERGKGYGTILLKLVLGRTVWLGMERVIMQCNKKNIASLRVMEKNGLTVYKEDEDTVFFEKIQKVRK